MDFTSLVNAFDLFADCYVYGSITCIFLLFIAEFVAFFMNGNDVNQIDAAAESEFYEQVKELFNPATEPELELQLDSQQSSPIYESMTIRELRSFIRENRLKQLVRSTLGKTVSHARKSELIATLQLI